MSANITSFPSVIRNKYELDCFQSKAFDSIDLGKNILVSAPTGSGKTTVADYAIEHAKWKNSSAKIIYTCPIKALCNEKYRDMTSENVKFIGRCGQYVYIDMHQAISSDLSTVKKFINQNKSV